MNPFYALLIFDAALAAAALVLVLKGQLTVSRRPKSAAATKPTGES